MSLKADPAEVQRLLDSGLSVRVVADRVGVSTATIYSYRNHGVSMSNKPKRTYTDDEKEAVVAQVNGGLPATAVSRHTGINASLIRRWCRKADNKKPSLKNGGCDSCKDLAECKIRERTGQLLLCERYIELSEGIHESQLQRGENQK